MTSTVPTTNGEHLKKLLRDRIEELERNKKERPKNEHECEADEALNRSAAELHAIAADTALDAEAKVRALLKIHENVMADVSALETELTQIERRMVTTQADYEDVGDELQRTERVTEKLKKLSRELARQNKAILEESERRADVECAKREAIVAKFDDAMRDIHAKLAAGEDVAPPPRDDDLIVLRRQLRELSDEYEAREVRFKEQLEQEEADAHIQRDAETELQELQRQSEADLEALQAERRTLRELEQTAVRLRKRAKDAEEKMASLESHVRTHQDQLRKQTAGLSKYENSIAELERVWKTLEAEEESLKNKIAKCSENARLLNEELEFWKGKSKSETEKRQTLERLCRTLTEERSVMRKEVQAMQSAWVLLETEIENLRAEISPEQDAAPG